MTVYQQPSNARDLSEQGRVILAHGEATGHHHMVVDASTTLDPAEIDIPAASFFEEPDGRRVLLCHRACLLTHQEHGVVHIRPEEAARGAAGERDAEGRLFGQCRQGDVFLHPIGNGAWEVRRQVEHTPEAIVQVID